MVSATIRQKKVHFYVISIYFPSDWLLPFSTSYHKNCFLLFVLK